MGLQICSVVLTVIFGQFSKSALCNTVATKKPSNITIYGGKYLQFALEQVTRAQRKSRVQPYSFFYLSG
jgi:hypothetical protein